MVVWHDNPVSYVVVPDTIEEVAAITGSVDYLFIVYGDRGGLDEAYVSLERQQEIRERHPLALVLIGHITPGNLGVRGLVLSLTDAPTILAPGQLEQVLALARDFAEAVGAGLIGLAGQIPSVIAALGIARHPSYVMGVYGSIYAVIATLEEVLSQESISPEQTTFGVVGIGFFGRVVYRYLGRDLGRLVIGYDPQEDGTSFSQDMILTNDPTYLGHSEVNIIVTDLGDRAPDFLPYCAARVVFVDNTHPRPSEETINEMLFRGPVYYVGVKAEGVKIIPSLPGHHEDEIPGCCLETILRQKGHVVRRIRDAFEAAQECGFTPLLDTPRQQ